MPSSSARPTMSRSFASSKAPPPLPSSLSARLHSTIDPLTGNCKHHPNVQICQLVGVHDNIRWVIRRKVCIKCGSRTPVGGFDKRVPGKAVTNPAQRNSRESRAEVATMGRSRSNGRSKSRPPSSRSAPVDQVVPPSSLSAPVDQVIVVRSGRVGDGGRGGNDAERFVPGKAVANPAQRNSRESRAEVATMGRSRSNGRSKSRPPSSRSAPVDQVIVVRSGRVSDGGSGADDAERFGRRRSPSRPRSGNGSGDDERRRSPSRPRSGNGSSDDERHGRRRSASRPRSGNGSSDDERHGRRRSASRPRSGNGSIDDERQGRRRSASRPRSGNGSSEDERQGRRRSASRPRHRRRDCNDIKGKTVDIERMSLRHHLATVPQGNGRKQ